MSKENEFDFTIPKEKQPDYLAELVSVIVEDFDKLKISDKSKEEISRRAKEIVNQTREETIKECEDIILKMLDRIERYTDMGMDNQKEEIRQSLINLRSK